MKDAWEVRCQECGFTWAVLTLPEADVAMCGICAAGKEPMSVEERTKIVWEIRRRDPLWRELTARRRAFQEEACRLLRLNNHEVLNLNPTQRATDQEVTAAYQFLAKRYHPDVVRLDPELADLQDITQAVFIRITDAYKVLRRGW